MVGKMICSACMSELLEANPGTWTLCGYHLAVRADNREVFSILLPVDVATSYERMVLH